jgi:hypothetical protein
LGRRHGRHHLDVPPEVTTGLFFVVVGGDVVVVVGGVVVVVVVVAGVVDPGEAPGGAVVGGAVVGGAVVGGDVVEGTPAGTVLEGALAPGCSLATTTPMAMVAPVAARAAARVSRRKRASVCRLVSGELDCGVELIGHILGTTSMHGSSSA